MLAEKRPNKHAALKLLETQGIRPKAITTDKLGVTPGRNFSVLAELS